MSIRIMIADDHAVIRLGITRLLEMEAPGEMFVVGEVADGAHLLNAVRELKPDVLLLDVVMPRHDVVAHVRELAQQPDTPQVIILSAYDHPEYVPPLIAAGISGFLLKDELPENMLQAIRAVASGGTWFSQQIAAQIVRASYSQPEAEQVLGGPSLTPREWEILQHLALGKSNSDIAEHLALSKTTVQNYVSNIYAKLGIETRAQAMIYAMRHKLVDVQTVLTAEG